MKTPTTYLEELKKLNDKWDVSDFENEDWILRDRILLDISLYEKQNELVSKLKEQTLIYIPCED